MSRDFSVIRRRPNFVDLYTPVQAGVDGYRLDTAANFDSVFTARFTGTVNGFVDGNIPLATLYAQPSYAISSSGLGRARFTFDPATYSITDTKQFWIRLTPVTAGVPGTPGAPFPIEQYHTGNRPLFFMAGAAPSGAAVANSLEINLPEAMTTLNIISLDAATTLWVALDKNGPEIRVDPLARVSDFFGNQSVIYVRGDGSTANFQITCVYPNNI